jgi:hypothetical protein
MTCILRAGGRTFDPDAFLADSALPDPVVHRRDDPAWPGEQEQPPRARSGFNVTVSDASMDALDVQIEEAIAFLDRHEDELRRLGRYEGVEDMTIDFGIAWRDVAAQTDWFPPELLWRAGALDIGLCVSHYLAQEQES